ncbi:MAG: hypothetical protein ACYCT2_06610 [Thermoplasmataceae archaeon]
MKTLLFLDSITRGNLKATYLRGKMEVSIAVLSDWKQKFTSSEEGEIYALAGTLNSENVAEKVSELFKREYDYRPVDFTILERKFPDTCP